VFAVHSLLADNLVEQTFITFGIGGICAASLISFSYCLPASAAYVLPASLPLPNCFLLDGRIVHGNLIVVSRRS